VRMGTDNDGCGAGCYCLGTGEVVLLIRAAQILNVREHPFLHTELYGARNDGTNDQAEEHRAMWNLHVVADFQEAGECQCLIHGVVAPGLEHHHRDWAVRQGISNDELRDHIKPNDIICHR
jgi:hypothetical protein